MVGTPWRRTTSVITASIAARLPTSAEWNEIVAPSAIARWTTALGAAAMSQAATFAPAAASAQEYSLPRRPAPPVTMATSSSRRKRASGCFELGTRTSYRSVSPNTARAKGRATAAVELKGDGTPGGVHEVNTHYPGPVKRCQAKVPTRSRAAATCSIDEHERSGECL